MGWVVVPCSPVKAKPIQNDIVVNVWSKIQNPIHSVISLVSKFHRMWSWVWVVAVHQIQLYSCAKSVCENPWTKKTKNLGNKNTKHNKTTKLKKQNRAGERVQRSKHLIILFFTRKSSYPSKRSFLPLSLSSSFFFFLWLRIMREKKS